MSGEDGDAPFDEPVVIPIGPSIDLHRFRPGETRDVVLGYLEAAAERGLREVRIIHGRGRGVQRATVRSVLSDHPLVIRFADAPGDLGGWGATQAWLRTPGSACGPGDRSIE